MGIPLVALMGKQPDIVDGLTQRIRAAQLQGQQNQNALAPGQQELQQQQIESQALQIKQQQQQQADQQAVMKALQDANGDLPTALKGLAGKVTPQTFIGLQKSYQDNLKTKLELDEKSFTLQKGKNDQFMALVSQAKDMPPDQYMANWPNIAQQALQLEPQLQGKLDPTKPIPQEQLGQYQIGLATEKNLFDKADEIRKQQEEQRKVANFPAENKKKEAEATIAQAEADAMQGGGVNPKIPLEVQEANSWLKDHPGKNLADYQKYKATLVPAFNFNLQAGGVGGGQTLPSGTAPEDAYKSFGNKGPTVRAIVEGRQTPPTSFAQKSPYWQDVMSKVYQVDPQFTEQRAQLRKSYTLGKQSTEINAINTAMGHVGVLGDAIDALNNGDVRVLNAIGNRLGVEVGKDPVTTFNTIVHRVGPELSKAYIGAGGSAGERGADEKDFDPNLGPQQLKNNVAITAKLLRSKIGALENQWEQNKAPGMKSFADQFITPEAKTQLNKWSPQAGSVIYARDKNGKLHQAPAGTALPDGWKEEKQ